MQKLFILISFLKYETFYIKLGDKNENQCFPYSSIVSAAVEISQSRQKLREAKICGITIHWYCLRYILGLSSTSSKINDVIINIDQFTVLASVRMKQSNFLKFCWHQPNLCRCHHPMTNITMILKILYDRLLTC